MSKNNQTRPLPPEDFVGLCEQCIEIGCIMSVGTCSCGNHTKSGSYQRCLQCAFEQQSCQACGAALDGGAVK
ncbi:MAG: hypothetical protein V1738_04015 [Patescibacteria group bacterium]